MTEKPTAVAPLDRYLASTQVIDWQTPPVHLLARELVAGFESDAGKARALFEWVRDNIPHSKIAFPEDPYFDGHVYPKPFPSVVRALNTAGNLSQLWIQLPDSSE